MYLQMKGRLSSVEFYSVSEEECEGPVGKSLPIAVESIESSDSCDFLKTTGQAPFKQHLKCHLSTKFAKTLSISIFLIATTGILTYNIPDKWLVITDILSQRPANLSCVPTKKYPSVDSIIVKDVIQMVCATVSLLTFLVIGTYFTPIYKRYIQQRYRSFIVLFSVLGCASSLAVLVMLLIVLDKMRYQLGQDFCDFGGAYKCPFLIKYTNGQRCSISVIAVFISLSAVLSFLSGAMMSAGNNDYRH